MLHSSLAEFVCEFIVGFITKKCFWTAFEWTWLCNGAQITGRIGSKDLGGRKSTDAAVTSNR
jgi:hypothetical protein